MTRPRAPNGRALKLLFDAALADHRRGRLDAAKRKYVELLRLDSKAADAAHLLGQLLFTQGDAEGALALLEQAIAHKRREARYHVTLAVMLNRLGRAVEAEASARRAIVLEKSDPAAYVNLAIALIAREAFSDAERTLGRALQLAPGDAVALANMGTVHLNTGRPETAADFFRRAVAVDPRNAVAWANLAEAAHDIDRSDEAIAAVERALTLDPRHAPAHATLGVLRLEAGAVPEAIACCERALALRPDDSRFLGNLANALLASGRPEAARAAYDTFLARVPGDSRATYNRGLCQLLSGELDAGLEGYEARWGVPSAGFRPRAADRPRWTADAPSDTRLFVWAEQGIGDHLFNAGFLPALTGLGVRCTYECDPRLVGLLARSFPGITVMPVETPPPEHDYQIPAGSLLGVLRTRLGAMPRRAEWLCPDAPRVAAFRGRLGALGPDLRVGLSWRSARKTTGAHKSMPLEAWQPILEVPGVRFVNLQYGDTDAEIEAASAATGARIHTDPDLDRFADIDGLAALMGALDLVITTSNVTAHIAGALGRPTWVALQKVPLWYWELAGEESRYYPSLRLFRQAEVGTWSDVAARLAEALKTFVEEASE